ncbi:hypothetical protein [Streptomyces sp. 11x1]|uniref:hypothetical protein n=1 Tax=Streptomyces sp. 11x1 TaxID=3038642 RepID=UPI00292F2DE8|nr:hypothetical protein [Streptomyces sp. 11x1]WNZ08987.1 hypothetical protein P8T65_16260 [Streptomyces sp. 11x1]
MSNRSHQQEIVAGGSGSGLSSAGRRFHHTADEPAGPAETPAAARSYRAVLVLAGAVIAFMGPRRALRRR